VGRVCLAILQRAGAASDTAWEATIAEACRLFSRHGLKPEVVREPRVVRIYGRV